MKRRQKGEVILAMVVMMLVIAGLFGGHMGMMGHKPAVHPTHEKEEAAPAQKDASPPVESKDGLSGHTHSDITH